MWTHVPCPPPPSYTCTCLSLSWDTQLCVTQYTCWYSWWYRNQWSIYWCFLWLNISWTSERMLQIIEYLLIDLVACPSWVNVVYTGCVVWRVTGIMMVIMCRAFVSSGDDLHFRFYIWSHFRTRKYQQRRGKRRSLLAVIVVKHSLVNMTWRSTQGSIRGTNHISVEFVAKSLSKLVPWQSTWEATPVKCHINAKNVAKDLPWKKDWDCILVFTPEKSHILVKNVENLLLVEASW